MFEVAKRPYFTENNPLTLQRLARHARAQGLTTDTGEEPEKSTVTFFTREELLEESLGKFLEGRSAHNKDYTAQEAALHYGELKNKLLKIEQDGEVGPLDKPLYIWIEGFFKASEDALLERSVIDKSKLDPANFIPDFGAILFLLSNKLSIADVQEGREGNLRRVIEQDLLLTLSQSPFEPIYSLFKDGEPLAKLHDSLQSGLFDNSEITLENLPELLGTSREVMELPLFSSSSKEGSRAVQDAGEFSNFIDLLAFMDCNEGYFSYYRSNDKTTSFPHGDAWELIHEKLKNGEQVTLNDYSCSSVLREFLISLWKFRENLLRLRGFLRTLSSVSTMFSNFGERETDAEDIWEKVCKGNKEEDLKAIKDSLSYLKTASGIIVEGPEFLG